MLEKQSRKLSKNSLSVGYDSEENQLLSKWPRNYHTIRSYHEAIHQLRSTFCWAIFLKTVQGRGKVRPKLYLCLFLCLHRRPKLTIREIDRRNDLCKRMNDLCERMNDLCKRIEWDVTT